MALSDHLRELRARLIRSALFLVHRVLRRAVLLRPAARAASCAPYNDAAGAARAAGPRPRPSSTAPPAACCCSSSSAGVAAIVVSSPYWLYQIWALHPARACTRNERKWSRIFVAIAGPLFFAGVALGYYVLPKGLEVLIGFTPDERDEPGRVRRLLLASSPGCCWSSASPSRSRSSWSCSTSPAWCPGKQLARYRPWIIIGTFVFAAVATPSTDPFSMLMLAIPMLVLFLVAEVIARILDRRAARAPDSTDQWARRRGLAACEPTP